MYRMRVGALVSVGFLIGCLLLVSAGTAIGGIYPASDEVTYKEYWIPHDSQWKAYDLDLLPDCVLKTTGWFTEPARGCPAINIDFTIPDNLANATKIEMYLDLWRNYDAQAARFRLNGSDVYAPNVGSDWSRTPWVAEIDKNDLRQGTNTLEILAARPYHIHDISFRVYYNANNPLTPGSGSDVLPPDGELLTIQGDGSAVNAASGGNLAVNNNRITLRANIDNDTSYVEFHAYYFGYDEDNDGEWRDWHNRGRNNCHPGGIASRCPGSPESGEYATIDHIGTVLASGAGDVSLTWDVAHIPDQENVRFKVRLVDSAGNVRDAAGGQSADFNLVRNRPVVAFFEPGFEDGVLALNDGAQSQTELTRTVYLPQGIEDFENARVIQSFWRRANLYINGNGPVRPNFPGNDDWQLSIRSFPSSYLLSGENQFTFESTNATFIEKPGPMVVMQRKASVGADTAPPEVFGRLPRQDDIAVPADTTIEFQMFDGGAGVEKSSIELLINGASVTPEIVGSLHNYFVKYRPPADFGAGEVVNVEIRGCDRDGRCITSEQYAFAVKLGDVPSTLQSDDFNRCGDPSRAGLWTVRNPRGDGEVTVNGEQLRIFVPGGAEHDLWRNNKDAIRLVQPANNVSFDVQVKFDSLPDPSSSNQLQGIVIEESENKFLRFDIYSSNGQLFAFAAYVDGSSATQKARQPLIATGDVIYLEVVREGNTWIGRYSSDGNDWYKYVQFTEPFVVNNVGVYAGNSGNRPAYTAVIDYFFNMTSPIEPEDAGGAVLPPVNVVGNGQVDVDPDCGAPVTLTALPDPGYSFAGWSGDLTGNQTPVTLNEIRGNERITATFGVPVDFVVNATSGGSVAVSPVKEQYFTNDVVTLNPLAEDGYGFVEWSGDLTGYDNPATLSLDGDKAITANFAQFQPLSIQKVGSGNVAADPPPTGSNGQSGYGQGTEVTLTATPAGAWIFSQWSGDATTTVPTTTILMDGPKTVTASFALERVLAVTVEGEGSVVADPVRSPNAPADGHYADGELVTLVPVPAEGWRFAAWAEDLSGTAVPAQLTMDGDKRVTARFEQDYLLDLQVNGNGTIDVEPTAADNRYPAGTLVTLTAVPDDGFGFAGWTGAANDTATTLQVVMTADVSLEATFRRLVSLSVGVGGDGLGGTVAVQPNQTTFLEGDTVLLIASPDEGFSFVGWEGILPDRRVFEQEVTITMNADKVIRGYFARGMGLVVTKVGQGRVDLDPVPPYQAGAVVTLTAVPDPGWRFVQWGAEGALSGTSNPTTLVVDVTKQVHVVFEEANGIYLPIIAR